MGDTSSASVECLSGEENRLAGLPDEILVAIFSFLDAKDLNVISLLGRYWYALTHDEVLWKQLVMTDVPSSPQVLKRYEHKREEKKPGNSRKDDDRARGNSKWKSLFVARLRAKQSWRKGVSNLTLLEQQHTAAIFSLAVNDNFIVSGSSDQTIRTWDTETGKYLQALTGKGHQFAVWCLRWLSGRNDIVLSASYDSTIKMWDPNVPESIRTLTGHNSAIWALDSFGNKIASGSTDTNLRIWDAETGQCSNKILGKQDTIWCCRFADNNTIISGGSDLRIWDLRACPSTDDGHRKTTRYGPVAVFDGYADAVRCLQADDSTIVTGCYDSTAFVYDRVASKKRFELRDHTDSITTLQYDEHGMLITSSFDHTFVEWDIATGEKITSWGHAKDDKRLPKGEDNSHRIVDTELHGSKVYSLFFDENRMISAREDGRLAIHDFTV